MSKNMYPSTRFHVSGTKDTIVNSEDHEAQLNEREPGVWFKTRQFAPPPPPPQPERSFAGCDEKFEVHAAQIEALTKTVNQLTENVKTLAAELLKKRK